MGNTPTEAQVEAGERWEDPAAAALASKFWPGAKVVHFPKYTHIDLGIIQDGVLIAALEVKKRNTRHKDYPTTMVLWDKHEAGRFFPKFFHAPVYCMIVWEDAVAVIDLATKPVGKRLMSRGDREGSEKLYALYALSQMEFHNDLLEQIKAAVAAGSAERSPAMADQPV
jgi:Holliday junction resolvase-like predicted endonuclease